MLMEAPDYLQAHSCSLLVNETSRSSDTKAAGAVDNFRVEELLDFSNGDLALADSNGSLDCFNASSTDSSTLTHVDSSNSSSFSGCEPPVFPCDFSADIQFSSDLCLPYDDLAELEWISNVTEESFSSEDLQKLQLISGMKATPREDPGGNSAALQPEMSVPAKARSKRSRGAPRIWTSRFPLLAPTSSSSETDIIAAVQANSAKKASFYVKSHRNGESPKTGRKCVHCATDQTPQWRTGPMGPKTLCNACGVRFKSGRLVPEYRPAASPTFVLTKHSNSHRKVMELRRQKEMMGTHQNHSFHGENMLLDASDGGKYLFKRNAGPDFSQLT